MALKNKKLRGMSLVELLAYTVILSIVTTALFQLIHFIEKMNDDLIKEQEIYSEFNLALLKLDTFISGNIINVVGNDCIDNGAESFYFTNDGVLCNKSGACPTDRSGINCNLITKPIFRTKSIFFERDKKIPTKINYDFYVPNSILTTEDISSYIK